MASHLIDRDGVPLCPEAEYRDSLSDGEFWAHVLQSHEGPVEPDPPEPDDIAEWELTAQLATPCPECGQSGACAYDAEGRALIHVTTEEDT